ncbi:MAG: uroporphyrinogen decarboxylase family protein [Candidatus Sumerlaeia bacterium]
MSTATQEHTMTSRERWLAALDGKPVDCLPFWPKIGGAYCKAQKAPFNAMSPADMHDYIGTDPQLGCAPCHKTIRTKTDFKSEQKDGRRHEEFITPNGSLRRVYGYDEGSQAWHPMEFPLKTVEDVKIMTEWYRDADAEVDQEKLDDTIPYIKECGERGVMATTVGESPLMLAVEHLAGVENAHMLLMMHPDEMAELFEAMHALLKRQTEITAEHVPADLIYFTENTSTTLISPDQYRQWCVPQLTEYGQIIRSHGKRLALHMCGFLKLILPDINRIPASCYEAFTSPPVGNTRFIDGRTDCPEVCLVGGTNAALWLRPVDEIIAEIKADLDALPHHRRIVVTSGGMMPPFLDPDGLKKVCEFVKSYPIRM